MAKFKEWFYKKISEDSVQVPSGANIINTLGGVFTAQDPAKIAQTTPMTVANKISKLPQLVAALSEQPPVQNAVTVANAKKVTNPRGNNANQTPSTQIQPQTMQPGIQPSSLNFPA